MLLLLVFVSFSSFFVFPVYAEKRSQNISFVGLMNDKWQFYMEIQSNLQEVRTLFEPRTPTFNLKNGRFAYIAPDGSLYEQSLKNKKEKLLLQADRGHAYTQPAYDSTGNQLYVVALKEGASVDTDILVFDKSRKNPKVIVRQRSAQFEPTAPTTKDLFYSNVLCTVGCGKIIQEIWHMDVVSGEAKQVTMVNSIARQPVVSHDGTWLYFSSNKSGPYHIWRMNLKTQKYEELTQGNVTDISPALDKDDTLYFIRRSPEGVQLMHRKAEGALVSMTLPEGVSDIRDLAISH